MIHCFETHDLSDHCNEPRKGFDNAHLTFIDGKLAKIETVSDGEIMETHIKTGIGLCILPI